MRRCLDKVLITAGCLAKCSRSIRHRIMTVFLIKKKKKLRHTTQNLQLDTTEQLPVKPGPKTLLRITATLIISNVLYLGIQANLSIQN